MDERFLNLGEEVTLTLLWQSGASESATVCFVISLSICYWLLKCGGLCIVCVCERERITSLNYLNRGLCSNTYEHNHCVCHTTLFLSLLELMVKLRTLLTAFTLILKAKAHDYGKGRYISDAACGVRPITMHCASWPIRTDCACLK